MKKDYKVLFLLIPTIAILIMAIFGVIHNLNDDGVDVKNEAVIKIELAISSTLKQIAEQPPVKTEQTPSGDTLVEETIDTDALWLETFADYSVDFEHKDVISGKDIFFTSTVIKDGTPMPYVLYTPSSAETIGGEIPLIVWLHGKGCGSTKIGAVQAGGFPRALRDWTLDGFNSYVVCPQLVNEWEDRDWFCDRSKEAVDKIVEQLINEYNIDTDRIIIAGHSDGAVGALFMVAKDRQTNQYYSAVVEVAGSFPGVDIEFLRDKKISARGYVGPLGRGSESELNYYYTTDIFASLIGEENIFVLPADHARIGDKCFTYDANGDNKSDLIEWMLRQYKNNYLDEAKREE